MLAAAKRPTLYVGVALRRHGLTNLVVRLAERLGLPVATDVLGKAAIPESHPQTAAMECSRRSTGHATITSPELGLCGHGPRWVRRPNA